MDYRKFSDTYYVRMGRIGRVYNEETGSGFWNFD